MAYRDEDHRIAPLDDLSDYKLEHSDQDLRGRDLLTPDGRRIGRVDEMLVDVDDERVTAVCLDDGRCVRIEYIELDDDSRPILAVPQEKLTAPPAGVDRRNYTGKHIPIVEERLEIGKRPIETGHLRIRKRVVSEPVRQDVNLRQEHVDVKRRDLDRPVTTAEAARMLKDEDIDITERGEKLVASKEAVVTGTVDVEKRTDVKTERVEDTVRRTEVDVDRKPGKR